MTRAGSRVAGAAGIVLGPLLAAQTALWLRSSPETMAAEAWAQWALHLASDLEPLDDPMDVLLCDDLRPHLESATIDRIRSSLNTLNVDLYFESEAPQHERGDGTSSYHCAEANWSSPLGGSAFATFFTHDSNGDEVWMAFLLGR